MEKVQKENKIEVVNYISPYFELLPCRTARLAVLHTAVARLGFKRRVAAMLKLNKIGRRLKRA